MDCRGRRPGAGPFLTTTIPLGQGRPLAPRIPRNAILQFLGMVSGIRRRREGLPLADRVRHLEEAVAEVHAIEAEALDEARALGQGLWLPPARPRGVADPRARPPLPDLNLTWFGPEKVGADLGGCGRRVLAIGGRYQLTERSGGSGPWGRRPKCSRTIPRRSASGMGFSSGISCQAL